MKDAIGELIGRRVSGRRLERGLTQEQLARLARISRQALGEIERGQVPAWTTIYLLAAVLRCEVMDLIPTYHQVRLVERARHLMAQEGS
jgi:DNA-binding XRE family transcriptional regulator